MTAIGVYPLYRRAVFRRYGKDVPARALIYHYTYGPRRWLRAIVLRWSPGLYRWIRARRGLP